MGNVYFEACEKIREAEGKIFDFYRRRKIYHAFTSYQPLTESEEYYISCLNSIIWENREVAEQNKTKFKIESGFSFYS